MYPEKKSKLNIVAGIIFIIVAVYYLINLLFGYLIPGAPINFSFIVAAIEFFAYLALSFAFFSGKKSHVFSATFALLAVAELAYFIYILIEASGYSIRALAIIECIAVILAFVLASVISAASVNNYSDKMNGVMYTWPVPGALLLIVGFISLFTSLEAFGYYFSEMFERLSEDFEEALQCFTIQFSLISPIIMGICLLFGLWWIAKPERKTAAGYQQGYMPNQGYAPQDTLLKDTPLIRVTLLRDTLPTRVTLLRVMLRIRVTLLMAMLRIRDMLLRVTQLPTRVMRHRIRRPLRTSLPRLPNPRKSPSASIP